MDPFKDLADCSAIRGRVIQDVMRTTFTKAVMKEKEKKVKELQASSFAEVTRQTMLSSAKQSHERAVAGLPSERRVHKLLGKIHDMRAHQQYQDSMIANLEKDLAENQRTSYDSHNRYVLGEMLHDEEILQLHRDMDIEREGHRRELFDLAEQRQADEVGMNEAHQKDLTEIQVHAAGQESTIDWLQGRNKTLRRQIDAQNRQIRRFERQQVQHIDVIAVSRLRSLRKQRMMKEDGLRRQKQHERQVHAYKKLSYEKDTLHERLNRLLEDNGRLEVASSTERAYLESQIFILEEAAEMNTQASKGQASEISRLQSLNDNLHQEKASLSDQQRTTTLALATKEADCGVLGDRVEELLDTNKSIMFFARLFFHAIWYETHAHHEHLSQVTTRHQTELIIRHQALRSAQMEMTRSRFQTVCFQLLTKVRVTEAERRFCLKNDATVLHGRAALAAVQNELVKSHVRAVCFEIKTNARARREMSSALTHFDAVTRAVVEEKMAEDAYDMKWIEFAHTNIVQALQDSLQSVQLRLHTAVERLNASDRREAAVIIQNDVIRKTARILIKRTLDMSRVGVNTITACLIEKKNVTNARASLSQAKNTIDGMRTEMSTTNQHRTQAEKNASEAEAKFLELDLKYKRRLSGKDDTYRHEIAVLEEQLRIAQGNEFIPSKMRDEMQQLRKKITSLQARNEQLVLSCQQLPLTPPESSNRTTSCGKRPFSSMVSQGDYKGDAWEGSNPAPSKRKRALG
ncbi:unnamed protein product [Zymoseptoria tritici ST99CH_1E4]|uniref:Uncharacterized protein n=1 Tax=Zymoseptoria tritici ST99CH_1E4 TaxID=1276532 RepID=A0A2H1GZ49_ZYMTR|nr:unnamed protein product [Zymoseptoria tritici ST99CH_1E4]